MANPETIVMQEIRLAIGGRPDVRLFRNNVGKFRDATGRWIDYGLCPGSSDLIGWRRVVVTPAMVGALVAVPVAIEVKTRTGRVTAQQQAFVDALSDFGGLAGIARSVDDADRIINAL